MREQKFSCKFYQSHILLRVPQAKLPALPDSDWKGKRVMELQGIRTTAFFYSLALMMKKQVKQKSVFFSRMDFQIALVSEIIF